MAEFVVPEAVRAVVFDVGETLVNETRAWAALADQAGVTQLTLFGALGALIERGEDHRLVWELLGVDKPRKEVTLEAIDFYPDAISCLERLGQAGYLIGLAGNQPVPAQIALSGLGLPVDFVRSSAIWGIEKPSQAFFKKVTAETSLSPEQILYVGDRLDNDVLPAKLAGMRTVFLRRGPWGYIHAQCEETARADARIDSLDELIANTQAWRDVTPPAHAPSCPISAPNL